MKPKNFLFFFTILFLVCSSLFIFTLYDVFKASNTYKEMYNFDSKSSKEFILPNDIFQNILSTNSQYPSSTIAGTSVFTLVQGVANNYSVIKIAQVQFNDQFSAIANETLLPTPLPHSSSIWYQGLLQYNNTFLTLQRNYFYPENSNSPVISDFFIRFTSDNIISNTTVHSDPNYYGISNNGGYDMYFPLQLYNDRLFTFRRIDNVTASQRTTNYFLSVYSLLNLSLISSTLFAQSLYYSNSTTSPWYQSYISGFTIDSNGYFWLGFHNDILGGTKQAIHIKLHSDSLKIAGSLLDEPFVSHSKFYNVNITIQPSDLGFQTKTVSSNSLMFKYLLGIQSNRYIETIVDYPGYNANVFLGLRVTLFSQKPLPYSSLSLTLGSSSICVIGIVYNIKKFKA